MSSNETIQTQGRLVFLKILFYRKWFLITPLFIGIVVGAMVAVLLPPTYESYTLILVEEQKNKRVKE